MIVFSDIVPHPTNEGWFILKGESSNDPEHNGPVESHFPVAALQYRAVEYGVAETDIQTLFKMVFGEIIDVRNTEHNDVQNPSPWSMPVADALAAKQQFMSYVSSVQNQLLGSVGKVSPVDRADLANKLVGLLPGGTISGVEMEKKKLEIYNFRSPAGIERAASVFAHQLMEQGVVNNAEAALTAGRHEVESRMVSG